MSELTSNQRKLKMSTVDSYNPSESTFIGAPSSSLANDLKNTNIKLPSSTGSVTNTNSSTILESENANYSIESNPEDEFGMPTTEVQQPNINKTLQVLTFDVKENEQSKTITIGRSSSKNDYQLSPKSALISRQHLAVTYFPNSNTLRIKCYGKNGLVVNFPKMLNYKLIRQLKEKIYELVPIDESSDSENSDKQIFKKKGITSFVLNEKEICFIPFMTGLQFGFGTISLELKIKHSMDEQAGAADVEASANDSRVPKNDDQSVLLSSPLSSHVEYDEEENISNKEVIQNLNNKLALNENDEEKASVKKSNKRVHSDSETTNASKKQKTNKSSSSLLQDLMEKIEVEKIMVKEVVHQLTNQIAFANIQQIPLKQLYQSNSICSTKLSLPEFRIFLEKFLLKLEPSIQIILRKGKDAAGKLLDPEFFYDVEKDPNEERVLIVSNLKGGRSGLRSCRKVHKQYFWKKPTK